MNRKPLLLLLGFCLLSMAGGEARANDMEYCAELTVMYRKYLGQTSSRQTMQSDTPCKRWQASCHSMSLNRASPRYPGFSNAAVRCSSLSVRTLCPLGMRCI